jgi:mycofactocin precursor
MRSADWCEAANRRLKGDQRVKERVKERDEIELPRKNEESDPQELDILEEIEIEDFAVDGICGVY